MRIDAGSARVHRPAGDGAAGSQILPLAATAPIDHQEGSNSRSDRMPMKPRSHLLIAAMLVSLAACAGDPPPDSANTGGNAYASAGMNPGGRGGPLDDAGAGARGAARPGSQEDLAQNVGDRVFFDTDKVEPLPESRQVLQRQADWLRRYGNVVVTIEGHADERGLREYNLALGERRAQSVKNSLVALGINPNRIRTVSYGKERPAVVGSNEAAWAQNRRAVTVVE
jgi:peptidoglycan-associated lipoprotein